MSLYHTRVILMGIGRDTLGGARTNNPEVQLTYGVKRILKHTGNFLGNPKPIRESELEETLNNIGIPENKKLRQEFITSLQRREQEGTLTYDNGRKELFIDTEIYSNPDGSIETHYYFTSEKATTKK